MTDAQLIDPDSIGRVLERALLWLTPKVVKGYDPAAFGAWFGDLQAGLREAVEHFRAVVAAVPPGQPVTPPRRGTACSPSRA